MRCAALFFGLAFAAHGTSLNVQVRDQITRATIADVELRLFSRNPPASWSMRTGADGKARFDNIPAGLFFIESTREGYRGTKVTGLSQSVQIKEGESPDEVQIALMPSTTLEGRVLDEDGRPVAGVIVHSPLIDTTTDAEGRYRLANLTATGMMIDFRIPLELRRKMLHRDDKTGVVVGYPTVEFYPGVIDAASATPIPVVAGMVLRGYDVRLRQVQLADFTGQLLAHAGEPLAGATVELQTPGSRPGYDETMFSRPVDGDGRFRFELMPPGAYVLLVYRGENSSGLPYQLPVEIDRNSVRDRQILVPKNQTLRGVLRVKDGAEWSGEVAVRVLTEQKGVTDRELKLRGSGEFQIEDIPPGEWQMGVSATPATIRISDKRRLLVTSAHFGATNPITSPIQVVESGNPLLDLELSTDGGRIAVRVREGPTELVMVDRAGASRWSYSFPYLKPGPDGMVLTDELAPGLYEVKLFGAKPVRVEVKAGETSSVELDRVVRKGQ